MIQLHEKLTNGLSSEEIEIFMDITDKMIRNLSTDD